MRVALFSCTAASTTITMKMGTVYEIVIRFAHANAIIPCLAPISLFEWEAPENLCPSAILLKLRVIRLLLL